MLQKHTRTRLALATLLAGALALPGLAAADRDRDRDWDGGRRGDWQDERGGYHERDYRESYREKRGRGHRHHHHRPDVVVVERPDHHHRPDVVVVERPVYRRHYAPPPPPSPIQGWGNGISVILQRSW